MKITEALHEAAALLRATGIADARPDARTLLSQTLARDHAFLVAHSDEEIEPAALALFRARVARRAAGEPVQYITGRQEFYGLDFEVGPAVLIPRPETELLVETALELLRETKAPLICDVGTGSGCIPIVLLHERRDARAVGLDISNAALEVAARNAARHLRDDDSSSSSSSGGGGGGGGGGGARLTLIASDCFGALDSSAPTFTLITSNPPYIAGRDIAHLQREVREHEPHIALTPGDDGSGGSSGGDDDGLSIIRRLIREAPRFLDPGGHFLCEIGYDQHEAVAGLVDENIWTMLDTRKDLQGIPRTVVLRRR